MAEMNQLDWVRQGLSGNLVLLEPVVESTKSVRCYCLKTFKPVRRRVPLPTIRSGKFKHPCCDEFETLSARESPPRNVEGSSGAIGRCPVCKRIALEGRGNPDATVCAQCDPGSIDWSRGGEIHLALGPEEMMSIVLRPRTRVFTGNSNRRRNLMGDTTFVAKIELPRRTAGQASQTLQNKALEYGVKNVDWCIPATQETDLLGPFTSSAIINIWGLALQMYADDPFFSIRRKSRAAAPAREPRAPRAQPSEIVYEPSLPWPYVQYLGDRNPFILFRTAEAEEPRLCECWRIPLWNLVRKSNSNGYRRWIAMMKDYPILEKIQKEYVLVEVIPDGLDDCFELGICHRCNKVLPTRESRGDAFVDQWLGWYRCLEQLQHGVNYASDGRFMDVGPDELTNLLDKSSDMRSFDRRRKVRSAINNLVKEKFELNSLGGTSKSEALVYQMVCEVVGRNQVERHYRPKWLHGLEIDIWIPNLKIGIEYQGVQHYVPFEAWGGEAGLLDLQARDMAKRKYCLAEEIQLIELRYDEEVSVERLREILSTGRIGKPAEINHVVTE